MRGHLISILALSLSVGCSTTEADPKDGSDSDSDTVPVIVDTFPEETDPPVESDTPPNPDDTGVFFAIEIEGQATVVPATVFEGWQATTAVWTGNKSLGEPKCMFVQSMADWATAGGNPGDDPVANRLDECRTCPQPDCQTCEFAFSVQLGEPVQTAYKPTSLEGIDTDLLGDTDPANDPTLPDPDAVEGELLNCDSVQRQVRPVEDFLLQLGVGFLADDTDATTSTTGTVMLFLPEATGVTGAAWAPYAYDAVWDIEKSQVTWDERVSTYEYVP